MLYCRACASHSLQFVVKIVTDCTLSPGWVHVEFVLHRHRTAVSGLASFIRCMCRSLCFPCRLLTPMHRSSCSVLARIWRTVSRLLTPWKTSCSQPELATPSCRKSRPTLQIYATCYRYSHGPHMSQHHPNCSTAA